MHFSSSSECWTPNDFFLFFSFSLLLLLLEDRQRFLGLTRVKRFQLDHTVRTFTASPLHLLPFVRPSPTRKRSYRTVHECIFESIYDFHQITFYYRDRWLSCALAHESRTRTAIVRDVLFTPVAPCLLWESGTLKIVPRLSNCELSNVASVEMFFYRPISSNETLSNDTKKRLKKHVREKKPYEIATRCYGVEKCRLV